MKITLSVLIFTMLPVICMSETVILKDGDKFEATKITEDGDRLSIQTKHGNIVADKADVENLETLGFANKSPERGPKTDGLEFISEFLPDGSWELRYFVNRKRVGTQLYMQSMTLLLHSDGKIIDGTYKEFYPNNKLQKEITIMDGQSNGVIRTFYSDGTLHSDGYFVNGKANGYFREFDKSGSMKSKVLFENGEPKQATETPLIEPSKPLEYNKPISDEVKSGKSEKANSFFIEGEIFTVGGADKEWEKNSDAMVNYLNSIFDYAGGDLTTYPGLGITIGVNMAAYKKSPVYIAASYVKGPSADVDITVSDSYYGSGSYTEGITTSFYRLLLGYKLVTPMQNNNFFVVDLNAGFGGGSIKSEWSVSEAGAGSTNGSLTESWTGLTWSIGPTFSWEYPGYIFELGGRYTGFPELKDGNKFSDVKWKPFSIKASILF